MCFDQKTSAFFTLCGVAMTVYAYRRYKNFYMAVGIGWFTLMEFLQAISYNYINDCESTGNKVVTILGFLHICFQPFFTHVLNSAMSRSTKLQAQYTIILRLSLLAGILFFSRYIMYFFIPSIPITSDFTDWSGASPVNGSYRTPEWIRGEKLCTFDGKYHLAWSIPMTDPSYLTVSSSIHAFMMFGPFFVMRWQMMLQGAFLFLFGPYLASLITPNLCEQASIWCFFSIAQIFIMVFIVAPSLASKKAPAAVEANGHANGVTNGRSKKID